MEDNELEERPKRGSDFSSVFRKFRPTMRRPVDVQRVMERLFGALGRGEVTPLDAYRLAQVLRVTLEIQAAQREANKDLHVVAKDEQPLKRVLVGQVPSPGAGKTEAV